MKKYRVVISHGYEKFGLEIGDIVTLVEDAVHEDLYELPKHLHGKGLTAEIHTNPSRGKEHNYVYIWERHIEEIKEDVK